MDLHFVKIILNFILQPDFSSGHQDLEGMTVILKYTEEKGEYSRNVVANLKSKRRIKTGATKITIDFVQYKLSCIYF